MITLWCPVQYACGMTYPKTTTATVEIIIAIKPGTILSKKIGSAYNESAFDSNKVDSS